MIETELKISLNAKEAARLRRHPLLDELALGTAPARGQDPRPGIEPERDLLGREAGVMGPRAPHRSRASSSARA